MTKMAGDISSWFWNPDIWLPPNVDWDNFTEHKVLNNTVIEPLCKVHWPVVPHPHGPGGDGHQKGGGEEDIQAYRYQNGNKGQQKKTACEEWCFRKGIQSI